MAQRIVGIIVLLIGLVVAALGGYGLYSTQSMAENLSIAAKAQGLVFDAFAWSNRWNLWSAIFMSVGIATAAAGAIITRKKPWGFLFLAAIAVFTAAFPWVLTQSGSAQYSFEAASVRESAISAAIAAVAVPVFFAYSRKRVGT